MPPASWPYSYLDVLAEGSQKIHETFHGEVARLPPHQTRNVRLLYAQDLSLCRLSESTLFDKPIALQREASLDLFAFGIGNADEPEQVDRFHRELLAAGYEDNGPPGERLQYHPGYYAAFVLDPDGNNIEIVHQGTGQI